jgi:hypothetical protein
MTQIMNPGVSSLPGAPRPPVACILGYLGGGDWVKGGEAGYPGSAPLTRSSTPGLLAGDGRLASSRRIRGFLGDIRPDMRSRFGSRAGHFWRDTSCSDRKTERARRVASQRLSNPDKVARAITRTLVSAWLVTRRLIQRSHSGRPVGTPGRASRPKRRPRFCPWRHARPCSLV